MLEGYAMQVNENFSDFKRLTLEGTRKRLDKLKNELK
jgi:hypothetical protein